VGRKVTDGKAVDVTAPGSTHIETGEVYRIDGWTGFSMDDIAADEVDRGMALECTESVWSVKTPSGTAATRGAYLQWATGTGFRAGPTQLEDVAIPAAGGVPDTAVAKVETPRNSGGYARIRLIMGG
jgi:hypothetical protein